MLKRCLSPLTLVNQLALIVLLSTALGVTGMAISGWLVQGVQGNAHAINEAGSLRMQSYRLLASVPLTQDDQPLIDEMERTAFSPELENAAIRAGQQSQLKALQGYWHTQLDPGLKQAQSPETVAQDVAGFVSRIDALVSSFDQTTELRIDRVVMVHRAMALFMGLLLIFTIIWLRARLLTAAGHGPGGNRPGFYPAHAHQRTQRNGDARPGAQHHVGRAVRKLRGA